MRSQRGIDPPGTGEQLTLRTVARQPGTYSTVLSRGLQTTSFGWAVESAAVYTGSISTKAHSLAQPVSAAIIPSCTKPAARLNPQTATANTRSFAPGVHLHHFLAQRHLDGAELCPCERQGPAHIHAPCLHLHGDELHSTHALLAHLVQEGLELGEGGVVGAPQPQANHVRHVAGFRGARGGAVEDPRVG